MRYVKAALSRELEYVDLYCVSDVHRGHQQFNLRAWETLLARIKDDPHAYCVLNGDLVEAALKSARFGDTYRTMAPGVERKTLQRELEPIAGKILAITAGNHEQRHRDSDENPAELIAEHLGLADKFHPVSVVLDVSFGRADGSPDKPTTFLFYVTHGRGGGLLPGAKINRVARMPGYIHGVDGFIMGHVHDAISRVGVAYVADPRNEMIRKTVFAQVIAGSMLDWPGSYAEESGYPPSAVSMPILRLWQKRRGDEHKHMEIILPTAIRRAS